MAIRNAGKRQNPKVIAIKPLAICILVEKIKQITKGSLKDVRSPKTIAFRHPHYAQPRPLTAMV
jgi:hypothetical protein